MEILIEILISLNLASVIIAGVLLASGAYEAFSFVNPKVIYRKIRVNWFGVILLTIVFNACFVIVSIPYWIYKICTVGRKCN